MQLPGIGAEAVPDQVGRGERDRQDVGLRTGPDGQLVTTDGPFAETKEALGGFYLVEAPDLDAALALGAKCPGVKFGSIEVRPVIDFSGAGAEAPVGAAAAD